MQREIAAILFLATLVPVASATAFRLADRSKLYYGVPYRVSNPCTLDVRKVFDKLPSYQEALKQPEGSAKRIHALKKASDDFKALLVRFCRQKKYDLAAERGFLNVPSADPKKPVPIPDVTSDLIKAIAAK